MKEDRIDADMLPVFIEEARDLLARIADGFMQFNDAPDKLDLLAALRGPIHTIKGSARMTGAMRFGRHWHTFEGMIATLLKEGSASPEAVRALLAHFDAGLQLFAVLTAPAGVPTQSLPEHGQHKVSVKTKKTERTIPYLRIRADLLDQFLNQAGEIAIAGSHVESGIAQLQAMTSDLAANIERIEKHVRQAAIQTEIHMQSLHQKERADTYFDTLEFDRFTQWQELSRMIVEGVGDMSALQKNLGNIVGNVRESASRRSRLTRGLQQDIMAARMVKFKSINERLQRLIKQVARELDKEVVLDVLGINQEVDRSVLEKMTVVLEHLLRNAIAHGIEHRLTRLDAGKTAHGNLFVEVRTEGQELLLRIADDGQGMDLPRIKVQAVRYGLLSAHQDVTNDNVFALISHPGLSTSDTVTTVSGRGVGLDVVRVDVASLGGRVEVDTRPGQGTLWLIYLPLTLAVTPVVLMRVGESILAIASRYVEQVIRTNDVVHPDMVDGGHYRWHDEDIPVASLARLLQVSSDVHPAHAAVMIKSGKQYMVVLVDAVLGNKDVVTKPIGAQLARVNGLSGATILGTGEIVLILHPTMLMHRKDVTPMASVGQGASVPPTTLTVMVVDDSLTVRRVLHKLLLRAGYAVMLAKDGMDALLQLQKALPDIVLVDIEMPRMDGFHLLEKIRARPETASTPVVMITSRTAKKHKDKALALGASAYLGKPYQEDQLLGVIATLSARA